MALFLTYRWITGYTSVKVNRGRVNGSPASVAA